MKSIRTIFAALLVSFLIAACLNGGGGSSTPATPAPTSKPSMALFAGNMGGAGNADGPVATASFNWPSSLAMDSAGNIYVVDSQSHTIRKITPSGVVSTLAGTPGVSGSADGTGAAARFELLGGIATDSSGNVYVTDIWNHTIRKITPIGEVSTLAGTPGLSGSTDGIGTTARFFYPVGVATDSTGNVYVSDSGNAIYVADAGNRTIRKITPSGIVSTFAGNSKTYGGTDGTGAAANFQFVTGISTDNAGNVYVADATIRKISPSGVVTTLAGTPGVVGSADGKGAAASFTMPNGIATDSAGNVFVAESNDTRDFIQGIPQPRVPQRIIRKITPDGVVTTIAGTPGVVGSADGKGAAASFIDPQGLALDSIGNIYVADSGNNTIRKITPDGVVTTLAGTPGVTGSSDGRGRAASFNDPNGIATDSTDNIYVADTRNNTIRKVTPDGTVSTLVGVAGTIGFTPGTLPGALSSPRGVAISGTSLYITSANGVAVVNNVP